MFPKTEISNQPRIQLTEQILKKIFKRIFKGKISDLATDKDLPYTLVYNLTHGRIKSLSDQDYRIIFGEEPTYQETDRIDGEYFRGMVRLWLFLNDEVTEASLYREFFSGKKYSKVDYRIFRGEVKTIEVRLEKIMEQKFFNQGLDRWEIKTWIDELDIMEDKKRVFYEEIKPVLDYLRKYLEINPTLILNQWFVRYESGELKTVPKKVYDHALILKKRTKEALNSGSRFEIEKLREDIYGKRDGLILYSEVEEELAFLERYGEKSLKKYLGRSISHYKKSDLKRIASWRAQKIKYDCYRLIENRPDLSILSVPKSYLRMKVNHLLSVLKSYLITKFMDDKTGTFERDILTPNYDMNVYESEQHGFTRIDQGASVLGMGKRAFDLMVAVHSDIFKKIGIYDDRRWYVSDLYLSELSVKEGFSLIKEKYELLARERRYSYRPVGSIRQKTPTLKRTTPKGNVILHHTDSPKSINVVKSKETLLAKDSFTNFQQLAVGLYHSPYQRGGMKRGSNIDIRGMPSLKLNILSNNSLANYYTSTKNTQKTL